MPRKKIFKWNSINFLLLKLLGERTWGWCSNTSGLSFLLWVLLWLHIANVPQFSSADPRDFHAMRFWFYCTSQAPLTHWERRRSFKKLLLFGCSQDTGSWLCGASTSQRTLAAGTRENWTLGRTAPANPRAQDGQGLEHLRGRCSLCNSVPRDGHSEPRVHKSVKRKRPLAILQGTL